MRKTSAGESIRAMDIERTRRGRGSGRGGEREEERGQKGGDWIGNGSRETIHYFVDGAISTHTSLYPGQLDHST